MQPKLLLLQQFNNQEFVNKQYFIILLLMTSVTACSKTDISRVPQRVNLEVPANFPVFTDMSDNPLTKEGIELGRLLFYDKRLSGLNQISCASCHKQDIAFSDGIALSNIGASGITLTRNAPPLFNMAWVTNGLFWDGGSTNLESQAFAPISSPDEMHQNLYELVDEIKAIPDYVNRFRFVFNDKEIKTGNIVKAIAQFERTLISADSRYDRFIRNESGSSLNNLEQQGMKLVQQKCGGCHKGELFTDQQYHNNGISDDFSDESHERIFQGRYRITNDPVDLGKFRTPSLRNIALTAPYMHDGRLTTLEQVLDHYDHGVVYSATLDQQLQQNSSSPGIKMTTEEKKAMISFLHALTDSSFIKNPKFSKP